MNYTFNKNKFIKLSNLHNNFLKIELTRFKKEKIISEPIILESKKEYSLDIEIDDVDKIAFDIKLCSLNEDIIYDFCINSEKSFFFTRYISPNIDKKVYIKINIRRGRPNDAMIIKKFMVKEVKSKNRLIKKNKIENKNVIIKKSVPEIWQDNLFMDIKFVPTSQYRINSNRRSYNFISNGFLKDKIISEPIELKANMKYSLQFNIENKTTRRLRIFLYDSMKKYVLDQYVLSKVKFSQNLIIFSDVDNSFHFGLKPTRFNKGDIISITNFKLDRIDSFVDIAHIKYIKIPKINENHIGQSKIEKTAKINRNIKKSFKMTKNTPIIRNRSRKRSKRPIKKKEELEKIYNKKLFDVVQIIFPITWGRIYFMRTMLLPDENTNITYLIQEECRELIENNYIFYKYINNIIFVKSIEEICLILDSIKVKKIILTVAPHTKFTKNFFNHIENMYFIHHGIILDERVSKILKARWDHNIKYMVANSKGLDILNQGEITKDKISLINGLPQFDYIIKNKKYNNQYKEDFFKKFPNAKNKKIILLVNASANIRYYRDDIFLEMIIDLFNSMKDFDYYLIIKNKYKTSYVFKQDNIIELTETDMIYNFFFADILIIIEGGTALVEALFSNFHKTIFIDWYQREFDLFKTNNLKLIRSNNCIELKDQVHNILNNIQGNNKELRKEKDSYLFDILGYTNIKFISDKIIKLMSDDVINKIYKYSD